MKKKILFAEGEHIFTELEISGSGSKLISETLSQDAFHLSKQYLLCKYISLWECKLFHQCKPFFRSDGLSEQISCLVGKLQKYTEKTTTFLKLNTSITYPIHLAFQNF